MRALAFLPSGSYISLMKNYLLILSVFALTACGGDVKETLGLYKEAPDEFNVVSRPPLSVPPEFYLTTPTPGAPPRFDASQADKARELFLKDGASTVSADEALTPLPEDAPDTAVMPLTLSDGLPSTQEASLLSKLGVSGRDPEIRTQLFQESLAPAPVKEEATMIESWLGLDKEESLVDPAAEAERIRAAKDAGKSLEGEVKTRDNTKKSVLDQLFD